MSIILRSKSRFRNQNKYKKCSVVLTLSIYLYRYPLIYLSIRIPYIAYWVPQKLPYTVIAYICIGKVA